MVMDLGNSTVEFQTTNVKNMNHKWVPLVTSRYCWWTKSCTTKDDDYPIIYRALTIQVVQDFFHQQYHNMHIYLIAFWELLLYIHWLFNRDPYNGLL